MKGLSFREFKRRYNERNPAVNITDEDLIKFFTMTVVLREWDTEEAKKNARKTKRGPIV